MKFSIRFKLLASFGLILLLSASVCFYALSEMNTLADLTVKLYNHPLRVTRAVLSADTGIVKMHRSMKDVALAQDAVNMEIAGEAVNRYEKEVYAQLEIVKKWILGAEGAALITETTNVFKNWAPIRNEVIVLMKAGQRDAAAAITKGKGAKHVDLLNLKMEALRDYAANKAVGMFNRSEATKQRVTATTFAILVLVVLISALLGFLISRSLANAVQIITQMTADLAAGDTNLKRVKRSDINQLVLRNDEMGDIGRGMDEVSTYFQQVIGDIVQVSQGLAQGNLKIKPQTEYRGDFAQIKASLQTTLPDQQRIIEDIVQVSQGLAQGDLEIMPRGDYKGDFERIKQALEIALPNLKDVVNDIVKMSRALAEDQRNIKPEADYKGDFIQIRDALSAASAKLAQAAEQNALQNWLKTGQAQLGEKTGGEQDLHTLSENIIRFLAEYLDAQMGVFYLYEKAPGNEQDSRLKLAAAYAYTERKGDSGEFRLGEGLVGQAALEGQAIAVKQVPEDYVQIQSGLGEMTPTYLIVYPVFYEEALQAVLELGSVKPLEKTKLEFLRQVAPALGITLNTAKSRGKMQALLQSGKASVAQGD